MTDLHVVLHTRRVGPDFATTVVAGPTDWLMAIWRWEHFDVERRARNNRTTRRIPDWYSVRSADDPRIAPALAGVSYHASEALAAKAYGRANAMGGPGGWITDGMDRYHGWAAFGPAARRKGYIGRVTDPRTGRIAWAAYKTVHLGQAVA